MALKLDEIADGVFAMLPEFDYRYTCNIGVVLEDDGITLIDTGGTPTAYNALNTELKRLPGKVNRIVLTHEHGDHTAGAHLFPHARIHCSESCNHSLSRPTVTRGLQNLHPSVAEEIATPTNPVPTDIVKTSGDLGNRMRLALLSGHSGGDIVAQIPDADCVFTGDLCFFGHKPLGIFANFQTWVASLETLKSMAGRNIVPGHGPMGSHSDIDIVQSYLEAVIHAAGSDSDLASGPWDNWFDPWGDRIPGAIDHINREMLQSPGRFPQTLLRLVSGEGL